ncbi:hypothetical protein SDC9_133042 [bioreactor metagenome]|uniref:Uncharacterized protein n=1 Tax=bioreactor metagenome TaxID=1076179 RepID=A0A645D9V0_9ZZZZ
MYMLPTAVYDTILRGGFSLFAIEWMLSRFLCRARAKMAINTAYTAAIDCITVEGTQK